MDTENLHPVARSASASSKQSARKPLGLSNYSRKAEQKESANVQSKDTLSSRNRLSRPRKALGDITNDSLRAQKEGGKTGTERHASSTFFTGPKTLLGTRGDSRQASIDTRILESNVTRADYTDGDEYSTMIPMDENGEIADIEPIPLGALNRKVPAYEPPEIDLGNSALGDWSDLSYLHEDEPDELPSFMETEKLPFDSEERFQQESLDPFYRDEDAQLRSETAQCERLVDILPALCIQDTDEEPIM